MATSKNSKNAGRLRKGGKYHNKAQMEELLSGFFQQHAGVTFSFKQIFKELRLNTHPLKMLAIDVMEEMAWDDFLTKVADNAYRLNTDGQVLEGRFVRKTNGKNSFIPDGSDLPIFVSERNSMWAMNGDRVRVTMMARRRNHIKEAMVTEILSHEKDTFVGNLEVDPEIAFLNLDSNIFSSDIIIPLKKLKGGKTGDKALVRVISWPSKDSQRIIGEVIDILGQAGDNTTEMHAILAKYGLPYRYPKEVEEAAKKITGEITPQDVAEREDFRDVWTCTIDPHDAKDFDDALSIRILSPQLYEVGVHIADVSHYVKEGDIIDREAQKRATSVYLVDRTIPMLPEHLCNYVCSLRPDEDKLCYSVIFVLDNEANVKSYRIVHTIIRSNRRYAYEEAQALLEQNGVVDGKGEPAPALRPAFNAKQSTQNVSSSSHPFIGEYAEEICTLDALAKELRKKRYKNGAIDFDSEEMKFDVDEKGHPTRCYFKVSKDANKLIEEFMLLGNRSVAESVGKVKKTKGAKGKPGEGGGKTLPYRVHDNPDPQKFEDLRTFVARFGYKLKSSSTKGATARSMNQLITESQGSREEKLIHKVALRTMMKAKYSTHNIGHFGLAFDYYTHFTSPIRRYPDTMVHRLLTHYQQGGKSANRNKYEDLCEHSSDMEQIAQNAERESIKYKMVEFMEDKIGNVYDAHISGITSYGIYCEIDENHCEGMIMMRDLGNDYYDFDEKNYCLIGRRRHHRYQLGDPIRIEVVRTNLEKRQLDFILAD